MILRPRTCCVYCGRRIPGALTRSEHDRKPSRELRFAARITCPEHRDLPMLDPAYDYDLERV